MAIVVFNGKSYECSRAVKGVNYIKLYDDNNKPIIAFQGISDFSAFTLQEGTWEKSVCTDIVGANSTLANNNIQLTIIGPAVIETGLAITFRAPCDCNKAGNIIIQNKSFKMVDAAGVAIASNFKAFASGALVTIVLSLEDLKAYIQNGAASHLENGGTGATTAADACANLGAARIQIGSYVGTGKTGESNKNTLTFNFEPKFIIVSEMGTYKIFAARGETSVYVSQNDVIPLTWSGNTVSWYSTEPYEQLNYSGRTYNYVAIG